MLRRTIGDYIYLLFYCHLLCTYFCSFNNSVYIPSPSFLDFRVASRTLFSLAVYQFEGCLPYSPLLHSPITFCQRYLRANSPTNYFEGWELADEDLSSQHWHWEHLQHRYHQFKDPWHPFNYLSSLVFHSHFNLSFCSFNLSFVAYVSIIPFQALNFILLILFY